jgi:hypothetical protein
MNLRVIVEAKDNTKQSWAKYIKIIIRFLIPKTSHKGALS